MCSLNKIINIRFQLTFNILNFNTLIARLYYKWNNAFYGILSTYPKLGHKTFYDIMSKSHLNNTFMS